MQTKSAKPTHQIIQSAAYLRARDLAQLGVAGATLQQMLQRGELVRVSRGLYVSSNKTLNEFDQLAQLATKYPIIVFCLLTALKIHGLTTQNPPEVWVAIAPNARAPKITYPPLRVARYSELNAGTEWIEIDADTRVAVTSAAKTVADCFKFRNKIGLDVALEALREAWHQKKVTMDELWQAAQLCRVSNVMRPYLESLV